MGAKSLPLFAVAATLLTAANPFEGRWAMQSTDGRVFWLEVKGDQVVEGVFFGATGGRLAKLMDVRLRNGSLSFAVERDFGNGRIVRAVTDATASGDALQGVTTIEGKAHRWTGWRSPLLKDRDDGSWRKSAPVQLLREGLPALRSIHPGREREWTLKDGVLHNNTPKADLLVTREVFWNFELHAEYKLPANGNSGIGLRNHYELQLAGDFGQPPDVHGNVSIYSRIRPRVNATRPPQDWQMLDVRLVGRELTAVLNGVKVIDRQVIEGLSGLALDPHEERPGPIALQGDHGPVEFRNVVITPLVQR